MSYKSVVCEAVALFQGGLSKTSGENGGENFLIILIIPQKIERLLRRLINQLSIPDMLNNQNRNLWEQHLAASLLYFI